MIYTQNGLNLSLTPKPYMRSKAITLFLSLGLSTALVACGGAETTAPTEGGDTAPAVESTEPTDAPPAETAPATEGTTPAGTESPAPEAGASPAPEAGATTEGGTTDPAAAPATEGTEPAPAEGTEGGEGGEGGAN